MKVSYDILKKFVTPPRKFTARELAEQLTMSVVEVESWESQVERLNNVVVGLVTKVESHPNADKLKLAHVDCGSEQFDVVCGGVNLKEGIKVAFAKIGAQVRWHGEDNWTELQAAKIRGVESHGMICAAEELELPDSAAIEHGIMDLSHLSARPGTPVAEALELCDVVLDIDNKSITHRPDLWGHLGLARELAALWKAPLRLPETAELKPEIDVPLMVSVKKPAKVVRYMAVAVEGVKAAESPAWLRQALTALGMRPINVIVDITNYVMLELGQPLHAFDLDKLGGTDIVIRQAKQGEKFVTLDGITRTLDESMLMIADRTQAQAIAGVMGGQTSEVSASTANIVLESATFEAVNVRKTATALGLRTEASARFEKALDPKLPELALRRAVELLTELCPGARVASPVVDVYDDPPAAAPIALSLPWLYKRLGTVIPEAEVVGILERLGFTVQKKAGELLVTAPSWRATRDITIPEDLLEEVARMYGYGNIPLALPKSEAMAPEREPDQVARWKVRDVLVAQGYTESLSYSFLGSRALEVLPPEVLTTLATVPPELLELMNPVNQAEPNLRAALMPNFVSQLILNALHLPQQLVQMFELGRVFTESSGGLPAGEGSATLPQQPWHLAVALRLPGNDAARTYQLLRGALDSVAGVLGFTFTLEPVGPSAAKVMVQGKHVGGVALVQFMKSSLKPLAALAEINLELLPN